MTMKYQTNEEEALSTVIGNLAKDMSLNFSNSSKTSFRMMKQFNASFIRLRERDGQLTIGERIDREKIFDILEDAPVGLLLLDFNAVDPDEGLNGEVVYGFGNQVPSEIRQRFSVDRKSGRLTLESPIDFESKKTYEFDIQASDLGPNPSPSTCKVVVHVQDVNDNAPEITITPMTSVTAGIAYITEAAAKESFVALVSIVDKDSGANGDIHCTLYGHNHFKLQQAYEDSFMIVTTCPLDREKIAEYNLTVVAEDLGSPPFRTSKQYTIRLSDENDNAPVFSKPVFEVSLMENNAPGAYITTVVARDLDQGENSKISYKLLDTYIIGSPVSTFISLDPATGSLYALRSFNFEVLKQLQLHIQASDGGSPQLQGSAVINVKIVDQNDNAPSITQPALINNSAEVLLPKDAPSGYVITQVHARDADEGVNAELSFRISEGVASVFSINRATGEICLNHELSYEAYENLRITVSVSDNGRPSLTTALTINFIMAGSLPSDRNVFRHKIDEETQEGDHSIIIIVVLAGSCALLLLAIIIIATTCNKGKVDNQGHSHSGKEDRVQAKGNHSDPLISIHSDIVFDIHPYKTTFSGLIQRGIDISCSSEDGTCVSEDSPRELGNKSLGVKSEGFSTVPSKDAMRQIPIWKGTSYATISAREPHSGKDSGVGDSDFNDSDSDISSDGLRKEEHQNNIQDSLWACTSECKILGHSDHCWSPTASRTNCNLGHSFAKTGSLSQDTLRRENYIQAHIPKTVGLQSVCEKVLHRDSTHSRSRPSLIFPLPQQCPLPPELLPYLLATASRRWTLINISPLPQQPLHIPQSAAAVPSHAPAGAPSFTFPLPQQFPLPLEHLPYPPPPQQNPLPLPLEPLPFLPTITAVPTPAGAFSISCRSSTCGSPSHSNASYSIQTSSILPAQT
ncbi:hypothetical protein Q8A67_004700 [Cirrhinus molitorella]|uniref:Cadherin domain-containing protein n=1 Tax=Cirrhinus molitorella TaxID=172907 RepID=A0AA88QB84_9TELE|nr:hypothetical protein Q8A67_004700 [Cirrhinus molitorella]